ncbi:hypothetical protein V8E36_009732 [Tilletia maclaganii]
MLVAARTRAIHFYQPAFLLLLLLLLILILLIAEDGLDVGGYPIRSGWAGGRGGSTPLETDVDVGIAFYGGCCVWSMCVMLSPV